MVNGTFETIRCILEGSVYWEQTAKRLVMKLSQRVQGAQFRTRSRTDRFVVDGGSERIKSETLTTKSSLKTHVFIFYSFEVLFG